MGPKGRFFAVIAVAALGLAIPAAAQAPPGGQAPAAQQQRGMVTAEEAIRIATQHGVVSIEEVERDDDIWEIEGRDAQGREIEVEIDIRTGQVVDIDR